MGPFFGWLAPTDAPTEMAAEQPVGPHSEKATNQVPPHALAGLTALGGEQRLNLTRTPLRPILPPSLTTSPLSAQRLPCLSPPTPPQLDRLCVSLSSPQCLPHSGIKNCQGEPLPRFQLLSLLSKSRTSDPPAVVLPNNHCRET